MLVQSKQSKREKTLVTKEACDDPATVTISIHITGTTVILY